MKKHGHTSFIKKKRPMGWKRICLTTKCFLKPPKPIFKEKDEERTASKAEIERLRVQLAESQRSVSEAEALRDEFVKAQKLTSEMKVSWMRLRLNWPS